MKLAIIGTGNIGQAAFAAAKKSSDIEVVGLLHHDDNIEDLDADVALLCLPTREVPLFAQKLLKLGISTVDSFDIHSQIYDVREDLMWLAKQHKAVSIISAGWDPGSDSIIRALFSALVPDGDTYTNFGPGRSMGHTVAAKAIPGVKDALSMTLPAGKGQHNRHVYIELEDGYSFQEVKAAILRDDYFAHDKTEIEQVESVAAINTTAHGVHIERNGLSGVTPNQQLDFTMRIDNPALTAQFMVCCARAAYRMMGREQYGAFTTIELAPIDLLAGHAEDIIRTFV